MIQPANLLPVTTTPISPLRLLGEGSRLLLDATALPVRLPSLILGEQVTARVADQLANNQVAVLIKNGLFTLQLPPGATLPGETLSLKVASLQPTLTFVLQGEGKEAAPAQQDGSVHVKLSAGSQYLTDLLQSGEQTAKAKSLPLDAGKHAPAQLAGELQKGVSHSGLFYEAHLKDWANGQGKLADLLHEPQARLGQPTPHAAEAQLQDKSVMQELGSLVQRQLNTLEHQAIQIAVQAWPGQDARLEIERESERRGQGGEEEEAAAWSTRLSLQLPGLGGVSARIRMVGQQVQVSFDPEQPQTGQLIQQHATRLEQGLAAAGLSLAGLAVDE